MYLLDTNIWLERLLDQDRSDEVGRFLDHVPPVQVFITDFAFHSIGVVLSKLNRMEVLLRFRRLGCRPTADQIIDRGRSASRMLWSELRSAVSFQRSAMGTPTVPIGLLG